MKHLVALVLMVVLIGTGQAQTAPPTPTPFANSVAPCGSGLPCGPIPWPLPRFPQLASPTPLPTTSSSGLTIPHATYPGAGLIVEETQAANMAGGLLDTAQAIGTVAVEGTPMNLEGELSTLTGNAATFIAYAKAVGSLNFGPFTPLVMLLFSAFVAIIIYRMTTFMLPVLGVVVGMIRKVIQLVLDFIPF